MSKSEKLSILDSILNELDSFIVAFSGGVDSTFLLHRSHIIRKSDVIGITIRTPYIPDREISEAIEFTGMYGINHKILDLDFPEIIRNNPVNRCYLCKKRLFSELTKFAQENKYPFIIDGTNSDDTGDYRPGIAALKELGIRSPLLEAGFTKSDIRELALEAGLKIWDKPAMACLLTRIPYDTQINYRALRMIEEAENMLSDLGFPGTRVRLHGDLARIECMPGYIENILENPGREHIISNMKKIGFRYVSLDLEGYRTGSSNPEKK